jgi:hypothetical protein
MRSDIPFTAAAHHRPSSCPTPADGHLMRGATARAQAIDPA